MASSFAFWFRGTPTSNTAAVSTGHFANSYRGVARTPVVRVGTAQTASASGGARAGGSVAVRKATTVATASALGLGGGSSAFVAHVVLVGGGFSAGGSRSAGLSRAAKPSGGARFGGSSRSLLPTTTTASFRYWRRGVSVSSTAKTATGHFDHSYRGRLGVPVVNPSLVTSFTATASGGSRLGGAVGVHRSSSAHASGGLGAGGSSTVSLHATPAHPVGVVVTFSGFSKTTVVWSPPATGGLAARGIATAKATYRAVAAGGFTVGGRAAAGLSRTLKTSGGWSLGGRSVASRSTAIATSGGATFGGRGIMIEVGYNIYVNDGQGGPINYATPAATVYDPLWTSPVLAAPSSYKFGVRAFGADSGLEECNLDASVQLDLDAGGADVTWVPHPPLGVRALQLAGGRVRIEWTSQATDPRRRPTGFHVYAQSGVLTDYTTPAAVAPYATDLSGTFAVEIGPLVDGVTYAVGVRAYNTYGEEHNTTSVPVRADGLPPSPLDCLQATPLSRVS
ncbi:MAG: hypothetical protein P4L85_25830 [Paludisphaera borealis]|uniref:hypothetical protein n=1 Tax=Paludisphaera borealis TaxID=1387353 RepID=UPI00283E3432|nr:hypothetical protein [Paludisphaera borealis]MDR3622800.1 hypothetical protein [Paludisphaera borealis]